MPVALVSSVPSPPQSGAFCSLPRKHKLCRTNGHRTKLTVLISIQIFVFVVLTLSLVSFPRQPRVRLKFLWPPQLVPDQRTVGLTPRSDLDFVCQTFAIWACGQTSYLCLYPSHTLRLATFYELASVGFDSALCLVSFPGQVCAFLKFYIASS